jgi:hypothetical protein
LYVQRFGVTWFLCLQADLTGSSGCLSDKRKKKYVECVETVRKNSVNQGGVRRKEGIQFSF